MSHMKDKKKKMISFTIEKHYLDRLADFVDHESKSSHGNVTLSSAVRSIVVRFFDNLEGDGNEAPSDEVRLQRLANDSKAAFRG